MTNTQLIVKSNYLIEASYKLTVQEQRLILMMASMIRPDDKAFQRYKISVRKFNDIIGIRTGAGYSRTHELTDKLLGRRLHIKKADSVFKTNWLCSAEHFEGYVELCFHPDLKEYLLQLKRYFTKYQLKNVVRLKSIYGIRIYELLKQYESVGERTFDLECLRHILGIEPGIYKLYADFKRKVLKSAQKEILRKTDLKFDFIEKKKGRKVVSIIFFIRVDRENAQEEETLPIPAILNPEIYEQLQECFCLSPAQARDVLMTYDEAYIWENLAYVEERIKAGRVRKPGPYTLKALKEDYRNRVSHLEAEKQTKQAEAVAKMSDENLRREYERFVRDEIFRYRETLSEGELQEITNREWENIKREHGDKKNLRLLLRPSVDEVLGKQSGIPCFEDWQEQKE